MTHCTIPANVGIRGGNKLRKSQEIQDRFLRMYGSLNSTSDRYSYLIRSSSEGERELTLRHSLKSPRWVPFPQFNRIPKLNTANIIHHGPKKQTKRFKALQTEGSSCSIDALAIISHTRRVYRSSQLHVRSLRESQNPCPQP